MAVLRNISGTWRTGTLWRNIGGTWRQGVLWRNIAGTWRMVSGQFSVTISPADIFETTGSSVHTTQTATVNPVNGVGPYTYSWSGSSNDLTVNGPSSRTTAFTAFVPQMGNVSATFTCTVTDQGSGLVRSAQIVVAVERV